MPVEAQMRLARYELVTVVVVMFTKIPVAVAVPVMVVFTPATVTLPVPRKETLTVMVGSNPTRARIYRTTPVSGMPPVVVSHRIPVSFDPYEFRARTWRENPNHTRWRWRSDRYSDRDLTERG